MWNRKIYEARHMEELEKGVHLEELEKGGNINWEVLCKLLLPKVLEGAGDSLDKMVAERVEVLAQQVVQVQHVLDVDSGEPTRVAGLVAKFRMIMSNDVVDLKINKASPAECPILTLGLCTMKRPGPYVRKGHFVKHMEVK